MIFLLLAVGLVALVLGGDLLVRGAVAIANRFGLPPLLIGLTLVGFGTSAPELVTSLRAATTGAPGIALGNVVGSNIANILLILGISALLLPVRAQAAAFRRDGTVLALATLAAVAVMSGAVIGRGIGVGFVLGLVVYLAVTWVYERKGGASAEMHASEAGDLVVAPKPLWISALIFVAGLVLTLIGARATVAGAVDLARVAGIPESVIGLTVVAVGTSLPELVTSVVAAVKRQSDVAFGNIVGSNIFNLLGILAITAIVSPVPVAQDIASFDRWVMLGATGALIAFAVTGWRVNRVEGGMLVAGYVAYVGWLVASLAAM